MLTIYKLQADHTVDFAAEELKKYLRMMMPQEKVVTISYAPEATEGFRLGLLEDFGLPCPVSCAPGGRRFYRGNYHLELSCSV